MAKATGIAGIGKIVATNLPDASALDKKSEYFDPKASKEKNPWVAVKVEFVSKFKKFVPLEEIKKNKVFKDMIMFKIPRLSVQPVAKNHFDLIKKLGEK
jgi:predicted RNA-binding protein with PUA-like domain